MEPLGGKYHRRSSNRQFAKIIGRDLQEVDRILYGKATWKSWKKQDYYLIGKKTDYRLFEQMHRFLWYGVRETIDKKPSANPEALKAKGYPFEKQISTGYGHGGLAADSLFLWASVGFCRAGRG